MASLLVAFLSLPVLVGGVLQGFLHRKEGEISCGRFSGKRSFSQMPMIWRRDQLWLLLFFSEWGGELEEYVIEFFKKYCATGSAWPGVDLGFCPWLLLLKYWRGGSVVVKTNEWEETFFWPIAVNTVLKREWDWIERAKSRPGLRSKDLRLNVSA